MKTIIILLDACRSDYINQMPFLKTLAKNNVYVKKVHPSPSFSERTEILTGMTPLKSNCFTAIGFNKNKSEYSKRRLSLSSFRFLEIFNKRITREISKRFYRSLKVKMPPYQIPYKLLPNLCLMEDYKNHEETSAFNHESIVDVATRHNLKFDFSLFTHLGKKKEYVTEEEKKNRLEFLLNSDIDFSFVYCGITDVFGHKYLNNEVIMKEILSKLDNHLKTIYINYFENRNDVNLVILGDHGMTSIEKYIDINKIVKKYVHHNKIHVFLDSTYARFYFQNRNNLIEQKNKLVKYILDSEMSKDGFIIDEPFSSEYGDLIWAANIGVLVYPDYFNGKVKDVGMHGYYGDSDELCGLCIICNKNKKKMIDSCRLIDICPTLCSLLKIPCPNGNEGVSLLDE